MAASGVKVEGFGADPLKDKAGFQPFAAFIETIAQVTNTEPPMLVGNPKIIADALDDLAYRFPLFGR